LNIENSIKLSIEQGPKDPESDSLPPDADETINQFLKELNWDLPVKTKLYVLHNVAFKDLDIETEAGTGGGGFQFTELIVLLNSAGPLVPQILTAITAIVDAFTRLAKKNENSKLHLKNGDKEFLLEGTQVEKIYVNDALRRFFLSNEAIKDTKKEPSRLKELESELKKGDPKSTVRKKNHHD
jgi:hypothetical protein